MSIAKIIAPVTGTARDISALEAAFAAAKPFAAHVVALYVHADPRFALPYIGTPISPDVVQDIVNAALEVSKEAAKAGRNALAQTAHAAGAAILNSPAKTATVSCSFKELEGYFPQCVAEAARLSDLTVFGRVEPSDDPDVSDSFVETLMSTERPVLLGRKLRPSFDHVAIAWDGGAASNRAVIAALPFIHVASKVTILCCNLARGAKVKLKDLEEYLALHGKTATAGMHDAAHAGIGATLLDASGKAGADLLVMGGYGHSHLGETLFGGVTHYVRWNAELPVLMVH